MRQSFWYAIAAVAVLTLPAQPIPAQRLREPTTYQFRESGAFRGLDQPTKKRLEQVVTDFAILEKALNAYMENHDGSPPESLQALVPTYLSQLPVDPFATPETPVPEDLKHFERSRDGDGYLYHHRPSGLSIRSYDPFEFDPSPGAWKIRSRGLRKFPLRYRVSNPGLIRSRGYWGRHQLDIF